VTLYTNGVLKGTVTASNFPLPRACIGGDLISGTGLTDPMLGSLDEIQTFRRALSGAEIASIYAAGSAGLVRAPQFTGIITNGNSQVQLNLEGLTGRTITLYSSTNLFNWGFIGTLSNPSGTVQYLDSLGLPQNFYRATQP
jgi:hypothetical protein